MHCSWTSAPTPEGLRLRLSLRLILRFRLRLRLRLKLRVRLRVSLGFRLRIALRLGLRLSARSLLVQPRQGGPRTVDGKSHSHRFPDDVNDAVEDAQAPGPNSRPEQDRPDPLHQKLHGLRG